MHAYASRDPVFVAMNQRGQRETQGALGDFCVRCHAPMAARELQQADAGFADLSALPPQLQGVTCYFCHNAIGVTDHANGALTLANDDTMRGGIVDPIQPPVHRAAYSQFHDRAQADSATLCGSCHDVVTPKGVHLERTFAEYQTSLFAKSGAAFASCQSCHMVGDPGVAAEYEGAPTRVVHEHLWPGVDVALTDAPEQEAMLAAVEECELPNSISLFDLKPVSGADDTAPPLPGAFYLRVTLETSAAHNEPSGVTHDRRMWLELTAYDDKDQILFQTGAIDDHAPEELPSTDPNYDPHLWQFRDRTFDEQGNVARMFWDVARDDTQTNPTLPAPVTAVQGSHSLIRVYYLGQAPTRVSARVRIRPVGLDVMNDLVSSGDLDPSLVDAMPTFTVDGRDAVWTDPNDPTAYTITRPNYPDCQHYRCLLDPQATGCTP